MFLQPAASVKQLSAPFPSVARGSNCYPASSGGALINYPRGATFFVSPFPPVVKPQMLASWRYRKHKCGNINCSLIVKRTRSEAAFEMRRNVQLPH